MGNPTDNAGRNVLRTGDGGGGGGKAQERAALHAKFTGRHRKYREECSGNV